MKITIEIDQEELKELLGKEKNDVSKQKVKAEDYSIICESSDECDSITEKMDRVISIYGTISWADILRIAGIRPTIRDEKIYWDEWPVRGVTKYNNYNGKISPAIHGYKITFSKPIEPK